MRDKIGDKQRLLHIADAITAIEEYVQNADLNMFQTNSMLKFASIKQIEIIGEASNHITQKTKDKFSAVNWPQIVGMRHILVHEYFGVDIDVIWEVIQKNLPALKIKVLAMIDTL